MRAAIPLLLLGLFACEMAPAESPDDVRAREKSRVEAARKHAEDEDRRERQAIADHQRQEREAKLAREATRRDDDDKVRRQKAEQEAVCASDRDGRRKHIQEALERAAKERARAAELEAYMAKSCTRRQVEGHDELACPADAPPELRPGGTGIPTGVAQIQSTPEERSKNDRCQDVQDLLKK